MSGIFTSLLVVAMFAVLGVSTEGWWAASDFDAGDVLVIGYLAVGVTAVAFVLWYSCVRWLGAARAGLLTGVAPIAAAAIGIPLTGYAPAAPVWVGIALIASGLALGLGRGSSGESSYRLVPHMIRAGVPGILRGPSTSCNDREAHRARASSRSSD